CGESKWLGDHKPLMKIALLSMRIHGVLAEKHTFVHSSGRGRREIQCQVGHYLHPNGTHCCIKCHKVFPIININDSIILSIH
uniref:Uncharacterized protein n=1 Tax=Naja naja TaxID=35670 RepID=A0A8C6XFS6_NAJNA